MIGEIIEIATVVNFSLAVFFGRLGSEVVFQWYMEWRGMA